MSVAIVDLLDGFIAGLDYSLPIKSIYEDLGVTETTFTVSKMIYARERVKVLVDAVEYTILRTDYDNKTITVAGLFGTATSLVLVAPFFIHGTPYAVNKSLSNIKAVNKYPFVYLLEIIREVIPSDLDSRFQSIPSLRLFFLDERNNNWNTDLIYENVVNSQREYCDFVLQNIRKSKLFGIPTSIEIASFAKFGEYIDMKGTISSIFDAVLSGVELKIDLPIVNRCICC